MPESRFDVPSRRHLIRAFASIATIAMVVIQMPQAWGGDLAIGDQPTLAELAGPDRFGWPAVFTCRRQPGDKTPRERTTQKRWQPNHIQPARGNPFGTVAAMIPPSGIDAARIMHTGVEVMGDALEVVRRHFGGPLMAYPDAGDFEMPNWRFVDVVTPQRFEDFCRAWIAWGVQIIGGCCGLNPDHIHAAVRARTADSAPGI